MTASGTSNSSANLANEYCAKILCKTKLNKFGVELNSNRMSPVEVLTVPVVPESDKNSYRMIRLENGLKALLISVPTSKKQSLSESSNNANATVPSTTDDAKLNEIDDQKLAACALRIDVGHFSDPPDAPGLAHLLEHLMFLGTEKYPNENEVSQFFENSGGYRNANTTSDRTMFYFDVREQLLDDALDRFSYLFKAPLLRKDSMKREREAVDSEFSMRKSDEYFQRRGILSSLAQPAHPYRKFGVGNLKSLKDNIDDETLHKKVLDFKSRHYSAHRMNVCVQAQQSLDSLQEAIVKHFSAIPNNNLDGDDFSSFNYQNTFQPRFHEKVYFVEQTNNSHRIEISWSVTPMIQNFKYKPESFIAEIIRHEVVGSLQNYLRTKQWATLVNAGADEQTSLFALYSINVDLTDGGFDHLDEVLEAIFSYLKFLQSTNPSERLFREVQAIKENSFRFAVKKDARYNVLSFAMNMGQYPTEYLRTAETLYFDYDADAIKSFIDELNSRKFNIMISSSKRYNDQVTFESTEPWYGAKYTELDMPAEWIDLWENVKPFPEFALPQPNPFIADDFTILYKPGSEIPEYPTKILGNDLCELWHRQDDKFLLPTAYYKFYLISPEAIASPQCVTFTNFLPLLLQNQYGEKLHQAEIADLNIGCSSHKLGLIIHAIGFNQKLHLTVDMLIDCLKSFLSNPSESEFKMAVEQQLKTYETEHGPKELSSDLSISISQSKVLPIYEEIKYLRSATFKDFQEFCGKFGEEMKIKALIQGNVTESHALATVNKMLNELNFKKIENPSSIQLESLKIPVGSSYLRCRNLNAQDENSAVLNVYQIGPNSHETQMLLDLLQLVAKEPLFNTLRTIEQLAYIVSFITYEFGNILGYRIRVDSQETKFTAEYVDERIENFRRNLMTIIESLSDDDFESIKTTLVAKKLKESIGLDEEADKNWDEIFSNHYEFDRRYKEVECLSTITKGQLLEFYREHHGKNERKLSIQIIGNAHANGNDTDAGDGMQSNNKNDFVELSYVGFNGEPKGYLIEDFMAFKNSLETYPIEETN